MKPIQPIILVALPMATLAGILATRPVRASALLKPTSGVTQALTPKTLAIEARLRGAFAQTTVTSTYANPNNTQIEADFLYSAPKGSVVTGFAYWYGKEKVVARIVEKGRAAKIYQYITSRMRDPALVEMIGPNKFRARIFPIEARADLKIEVRLAQVLSGTAHGQRWSWPLREETAGGALQNVSVHLTSDSPFQSNLGEVKGNELRFERQNFSAKADANATVAQTAAPLRAALLAARDGGPDGFFALSLWDGAPVPAGRFSISGVRTYDVLVPTRHSVKNAPFVVLGRYRGKGVAHVSLGGKSVAVTFTDAREERNVPELLWASARMEALSKGEVNREMVSKMSLRFEMPSKWTSWLAIPEEERKTFKRQMWASDRADAARAYAQAVSRGDKGAQSAQKVIFDDLTQKLTADGPNYAANEELQPLNAYLNDELRRLQSAVMQAKYDTKIPRSQSAQWTAWAKNLERAGATGGGKGVEMPIYMVEDEMRIASRLYFIEVEAGRKSGAKARAMQARLEEIAATETARRYHWGANTFMSEQLEMRANALAKEIAASRASAKPNRTRERAAELSLARLSGEGVRANAVLQSLLRQVWGEKMDAAASKWTSEIAAGRASGKAAHRYAREVRTLQAESGMRESPQVKRAWESLAVKAGEAAAPSIASQGVNGAAARRLDAQVAAIKKESGRKDLGKYAWATVARHVGEQLSAQLQKDPESGAVHHLEQRLAEVGKTRQTDAADTIRYAYRTAAHQTAQLLAKEVKAGREDGAAAKALEARYEKQRRGSDMRYTEWPLGQAYVQRARAVADDLIEASVSGAAPTADKQASEARGQAFAAKAGSERFDALLAQEASGKLTVLTDKLGDEIAAKRENGEAAKQLHEQIARVRTLAPGATPRPFYRFHPDRITGNEEEFAWTGRAHEAAYRMLEAQKAAATETPAVAMQDEFERSVKNANANRDAVLAWEKARLAKNEPLITATQYWLRAGDPLISVAAPATCREVVALMPDGTLLPLSWSARNKTWEARFDVPTFALDGDYRVQIFIVSEDGARHRLTMNFAVVSKAPSGVGSAKVDGKTWHLRLESGEHTDRVSAFLPWGARVELHRDAVGAFTADVPVATEAAELQAKVRFVVTDEAHNKTEVLVDLNG